MFSLIKKFSIFLIYWKVEGVDNSRLLLHCQTLGVLTTQFSLSGSSRGAESKRRKPSSVKAAVVSADVATEPFHVFDGQ